MNKKIYNIGVIGVGVWGCHSLERELLNTGRCVIKSVCGNDSFGAGQNEDAVAAAQDYAKEFNAGYVDSPKDIFNDPEIDIVSVMTAPAFKAEYLIKALENNKYAVTDKPLGMSVAEVEAVCEAENKSQAHGFMLCGYHTRPAAAKLIKMIRAGELGEIKAVSVRLNFTGGIYPGFNPTKRWRGEIPGGESVTIGSHALLTAMKLAGTPVADSFCLRKNNFYAEYRDAGADDYAVYNLKFANGAAGNVCTGRLPYRIPNEDITLEVTGTAGYARIAGTELQIYPSGEVFDGSFNAAELNKQVFSRFLDSITNPEITPTATFADGLALQSIFAK